jgi:hypothetical protein
VPRGGEKLPRENRRAPGCALDLLQLLETFRIVGVGFDQELGVDLNYGEQVVQLVRGEASRSGRILERLGAGTALAAEALLAWAAF